MAKFLKNGATFQCSMGGITFTAKQSGGKTVHGSDDVLTKQAKLKPPPGAQCPILTAANQAPTPCNGTLSGWERTDKHVTSNGNPLLTNGSFKMCKQDPRTSAAKLTCLMPNTNVTDATKSASVAGVSGLALPQPVAAVAKSANPSPDIASVSPMTETGSHDEKNDVAVKKAEAGKKEKQEKKDPPINPNAPENMFCEATKCPEEKRNCCPYYKASADADKSQPQKLCADYKRMLHAGDVPWDASDRNFEEFLTDRWIVKRLEQGKDIDMEWADETDAPDEATWQAYTEERIDRAVEHVIFQNWTYAAHHLISVNQIFATKPRLVKLANAYKKTVEGENPASCETFDINGGWNCIMLPSVTKADEDDDDIAMEEAKTKKQKKEAKKAHLNADAYDVMSCTGLQWHLGPHGRPLNKEEATQARRQMGKMKHKPRKLKSYADKVASELQNLEDSFDAQKISCYNTIEQKQKFIRWMQFLARKIKRQLSAFHDDPKASYPYYVSIEAYKFAFSIPLMTNIAVIQTEQSGSSAQMNGMEEAHALICQTFRAEHRGKSGGSNELDFKEAGDAFRVSWPLDEDAKRTIIERLENIRYVVLASRLPRESFAFLRDPQDPMSGEMFCRLAEASDTPQETLDDSKGKIVIWLRDARAHEGPYVSKLRMIRRRLQNLDAPSSDGTEGV